MPVGFIGLGAMGRPMALRLLGAGYPLRVYDRRAEALAPLAAAGAAPCATAAEAVCGAGTILVMVSNAAALEEVLAGETGILAGAASGSLVVVLTTISPEAARDLAGRLAAAGLEMLDAPVSGDEEEAAAGTLAIMAGGTPEAFAAARPLCERLGRTVVHAGPSGAGSLAKACHQIAMALALEGVAEAFTLAARSGVDPGPVREALLGGFAGSKTLEVQGRRMLARDFQPGFPAAGLQRELREIVATAHRLGFALPGTALAAQHINALVGGGEGGSDPAALVRVLERLNGLCPKEEE